jgi:hypothetical protein
VSELSPSALLSRSGTADACPLENGQNLFKIWAEARLAIFMIRCDRELVMLACYNKVWERSRD